MQIGSGPFMLPRSSATEHRANTSMKTPAKQRYFVVVLQIPQPNPARAPRTASTHTDRSHSSAVGRRSIPAVYVPSSVVLAMLTDPFPSPSGADPLKRLSNSRQLSDLSGDSLHTLLESWVAIPAHARHLWLSGENVSHRPGLCSLHFHQSGAVHTAQNRSPGVA